MNDIKETKKVFHWFWAWQDEKEERWLAEMARAGWHLRRAWLFTYRFESGAPSETVYKLDYRRLMSKERDEYESLFRDSGWERVCSLSNWHYFRTPAVSGVELDIFSDTESRIGKYRRLLTLLVVLIPSLNIGIIRLLRGEDYDSPFHIILLISWVAIILVWSYAIVRIVIRMHQLKKKEAKKI